MTVRTQPLPVAPKNYKASDQETTRRQIEINEQSLADNIQTSREFTSSEASLALRKYQFLLMGASNV